MVGQRGIRRDVPDFGMHHFVAEIAVTHFAHGADTLPDGQLLEVSGIKMQETQDQLA